jgi:hypothetical protein
MCYLTGEGGTHSNDSKKLWMKAAKGFNVRPIQSLQGIFSYFKYGVRSPKFVWAECTEAVFVNLLRSPGIDSRPGGPVRQPLLSYRSARLHRRAESSPRNRFLSSLNVYKYGLSCTHWLRETQQLPPSPAFGLINEGAIGQPR